MLGFGPAGPSCNLFSVQQADVLSRGFIAQVTGCHEDACHPALVHTCLRAVRTRRNIC